ncbi:MAG TPA: LptA/OstA family protein [Bacillota bacterium]|nr:LptA/OstA family protein [Bacillota bacterium]
MRRVLRSGILLFVVAVFALSIPVQAKPVKVTAYQSVVHKGAKGDTVFEGGLKIEYDDIVITADRATVNMDAGIAKLGGKVALVQGDVTIGCDSMDLNIKKKIAAVTGSVRLQKRETQVEKDEAGKPKVSVITLTCTAMEIFTDTQDFNASGNVSMTRDKQRAQAAHASYKNSEKMLILTGSVFIEGENKESIKCDRAELHTDQTMVAAEGTKMEITFDIEE